MAAGVVRATVIGLAIGIVTAPLFSRPANGADESATENVTADASESTLDEAPSLEKRWKIIHQPPRRATAAVRPLPKKFPAEVLGEFSFHGPRPGDPFLLGDVEADGEWGIAGGAVRRVKGKAAMLRLGRGESFELEGIINAEGLGGWFLLMGWKDGHGYAFYNVTLKESGSPWLVCEFRDAKGIESTHREISRYDWKGPRPFRMTVDNGKLTVTAGKETLADQLELPNYHEGDLILGTYNTRYGAKPVQIHSLRVRAR